LLVLVSARAAPVSTKWCLCVFMQQEAVIKPSLRPDLCSGA
jgi:hypothetical protein